MTAPFPLANKLVTVFGGSGFIGRHVAQALLARGARLRIASRHPEQAHRLKPLANLGQLQFARCNVLDPASVAACLAGADAVVNLAGSFAGDQIALMGKAPGTMAALAQGNGNGAFVHVSAIGADSEGPTGYAQAKAMGEAGVVNAFPAATILRPSVVFGEDDRFVNMLAGLVASLPALPVFGPQAPLQPVHVDDVAAAVVAALENPAAHGSRIYELAGPEVMTMLQLHEQIVAAQHRRCVLLPMPDFVSAVFAAMPLTPLSRDQWALLKGGNRASDQHPGLAGLGIVPRPLSLFLDSWMVRFRKHGRFAKAPV